MMHPMLYELSLPNVTCRPCARSSPWADKPSWSLPSTFGGFSPWRIR
jgi:hypothetical protein